MLRPRWAVVGAAERTSVNPVSAQAGAQDWDRRGALICGSLPPLSFPPSSPGRENQTRPLTSLLPEAPSGERTEFQAVRRDKH